MSHPLFASLSLSTVWVFLSAISWFYLLGLLLVRNQIVFSPLQDSEENRGDYLTRTLQVTYKNVSIIFWANWQGRRGIIINSDK